MVGKKKSKSTKKFEKNRLKDTIDRRKSFAKVKQRHALKDKKRAIKTTKSPSASSTQNKDARENDKSRVDEMNSDRFFQKDIQIPETEQRVGKLKAVQKDAPSQTGKRKRVSEADENSGSDNLTDGDQQSSFSELESVDGEDSSHKNDLNALAEKDPEFYKFLKENDAELLDFEEDGDLEEVEALSGDEDEDEQPTKKRKKGKPSDIDEDESKITIPMVEKWKASMSEQHSIRALRQTVLAFRAAAHANEEDQESRYTIGDSEVYHQVLVTALKGVGSVLNHHLPVKETAAGKLRVPTDSKKFKTLTPLIKSHASSILHILQSLSDTPTLRLTLQSFEPLLPYLLQYRKLLKFIIKRISSIWSDNTTSETVRITGFLILRRLMITGDPGIRETVLKSTYEGIIKGSRNTTTHTLPGINLMKNSAAEIWAIDPKVGYTTGFTHIRQLAIHLRSTITKPTKDSYKTIYNWQFIHSLDFWSRVLTMHCNPLAEASNASNKGQKTESPLRPLIYPLTTLTLGTLSLSISASPAYFPLRLHLLRSLLRLSSQTGTFIPLAPPLLAILDSSELKRAPKPSTLRPLDFAVTLKAPTGYLRTRVYQDGLAEQTVEVLAEFFGGWCKSIAFPELQLPVSVHLRRWLRSVSSKANGNKNAKVQRLVLLLVQKLEANARWVEERREKVSFTPRDRTEVEGFLKDVGWEESPLGAYVVRIRRVEEGKRKVLESADAEAKAKDDEDTFEDEDEAVDVDVEG